MRIYILIGVAALFLAACGNKKDAAATVEKVEEILPTIPTITVDRENEITTGDNYTINDVRIDNNKMVINVSYGGGCETHEWKLLTNGAMMKSMPPQMNVTLWHNSNGDNCRGWITEDLEFNLSPINSGDKGTIVLRLRNYDTKIVCEY